MHLLSAAFLLLSLLPLFCLSRISNNLQIENMLLGAKKKKSDFFLFYYFGLGVFPKGKIKSLWSICTLQSLTFPTLFTPWLRFIFLSFFFFFFGKIIILQLWTKIKKKTKFWFAFALRCIFSPSSAVDASRRRRFKEKGKNLTCWK